MHHDVKLSIIIPTFNEEMLLPRLLNNLSKQVNKNFEVIIVDGNSKDNTIEIARRFNNKFPLYIYNAKKSNVSYQRNFGAKKAHASFICFIDADSQLYNDFTKKIEKYSKIEELLLPKLASENGYFIHNMLIQFTNIFVAFSHTVKMPLSIGGHIFISKRLFAELKGFNEKLFICEDHNLIKRAYQKDIHPIFLKDVKVIISARRIEHEGLVVFIYKMLYSSFQQLRKGEITKPIYAYEMGGQRYK
jgi:glycosyltransferase involved in cell wall biosynthesis